MSFFALTKESRRTTKEGPVYMSPRRVFLSARSSFGVLSLGFCWQDEYVPASLRFGTRLDVFAFRCRDSCEFGKIWRLFFVYLASGRFRCDYVLMFPEETRDNELV